MADTIPVRVQHKRMTAAQWRASSVVLLSGELGVESDTGFVKVGDGTNRFSALKYLTGPAGPQGAPGRDGAPGPKGADGVVTFESLTPQQKASLKGEKGDKGDPLRFTDLTTAQKNELRGPQGPKGADGVLRFEDLTPTQKASLKGAPGRDGAQGPAGPKGADGARGSMGLQGPRGEKGDPGQNILNSRTNQALKYWAGSKADYDRISSKDANTIYDVWE